MCRSSADIDGNGAIDVFIQRLGGPKMAGSGALLVLNDGRGRFIETIKGLPREVAYLPTAQAPTAAADRQAAGSTGACDLNGDGRTDLVTASYANVNFPKNLRVFQSSASGEFTEKFRTPIPPAIVSLAASRPGSPSPGAAGIACADLNGDGRRDLVVHWETSVGNSFIQFLRNDGNFQFSDVTIDWFGSWDSAFAVRGGSKPLNGFELRDLNGDGTNDFAAKSTGSVTPDMLWAGTFGVRLNDGTGKMEPMRYRPSAASGTVADLNRVLGCVAYCAFTAMLFDATGDGTVDFVLIDNESLKSRDLPWREDRIVIYTFAGQAR